MIEVLSRKFYSQIRNGEDFSGSLSDFSTNLTGSVMERIRAEIEVQLSVLSVATASNAFTVNDTAKTITRASDNWEDDGWKVGDDFSVTGGATFTGTIIALDDLELTYDLTSAPGTDTGGAYTTLNVYLTSEYLGAIWQFGLPENDDNSGIFQNVVDGSDQLYTVTGITATYKTMNATPGAKSWITGDARIKRGTLTNGVATYTIQQDFTILPYFLQEIEQNLIDGTSPVDYFEGLSSLKFIWNLELRKVLSDPNTQHVFTETDQLGSVGWFNENYNGYVNNFTLESLTYQETASGDVLSGISIDEKTTITAQISSDGLFTLDTNVGGYISAALDPVSYLANTTMHDTLWMFDNHIVKVDTTVVGTGVIKRIQAIYVDANNITIEIDVEYSASQKALLSDGQRFVLGLQVEDVSLQRPVSDVVMLLGDFGTYSKSADVTGLLAPVSLEFLSHPQAESDIGYTNVRGWIEDNFLAKFRFGVDVEIPARIKQIIFKLIARNTSGREFTIQSYSMDLSSGLLQLISGTAYYKQAFNLDTTRGFPLSVGDFMNRVRLAEYSNETGYRFGEYTQSALTLAVLYDSAFDSGVTPSLVIDDNDGSGILISASVEEGFTSDAGGTGGLVSYISVDPSASITGIRGGTKTLTAGTVTFTFDTLGTTDYTVIVFGTGFNASDVIASQTATQFELTDCLAGEIVTWVAVRNSGFASIMAGNATLAAGNNTVTYAASLGSVDYTLLLFDLQNTGNISNRSKAASSFDIEAGIGTSLNYIALLNP